MRNVGIAVLVGGLVLAGLMIGLWLAGLVLGFGGGLIHLLLIIAPFVAFAGLAAGVVLIIISRRQGPTP